MFVLAVDSLLTRCGVSITPLDGASSGLYVFDPIIDEEARTPGQAMSWFRAWSVLGWKETVAADWAILFLFPPPLSWTEPSSCRNEQTLRLGAPVAFFFAPYVSRALYLWAVEVVVTWIELEWANVLVRKG